MKKGVEYTPGESKSGARCGGGRIKLEVFAMLYLRQVRQKVLARSAHKKEFGSPYNAKTFRSTLSKSLRGAKDFEKETSNNTWGENRILNNKRGGVVEVYMFFDNVLAEASRAWGIFIIKVGCLKIGVS